MSSLLRKLTLFKDLLPRDFETIELLLEEVTLPAGHDLFQAGDKADCMYIIESGSIAILKGDPKDPQNLQEIVALKGGDVLGEMALVRSTTRSMAARTKETTNLFVLRKEKLATLMKKDMRIWAQLCYNIAGILATRLETMDRLLSEKDKELSESKSSGGFWKLLGR